MNFRLRGLLGWTILSALAGGAAAEKGATAGGAAADPAAEPTFITADDIKGQSDVETVGEGAVELRQATTLVNADRLTYRHPIDEVEAEGNVLLKRDDDVMSGPYLRLKVSDKLGYFDRPQYSIKRVPKSKPTQAGMLRPAPRPPVTGSGEASRIDFEGEGQYRLKQATFSTCEPSRRDWYVDADEIELDYNDETGKAHGSRIVFKDTPILYSPWMSFSLNNKRKSGLLAPTFGSTTTSGLELTVPWYWNIAPNMDAIIAPRILTRRGVQVRSEFRYLNYSYNGEARVEYLPNDRLTGTSRSAYALLHNQVLAPGLVGNLNLNGVSDDRYFADLTSKVAMVSQANLLRQGSLTYGGGWWSTTMMVQRFQTLQDPAAPVAVPYYRLPQILVTAVRPDLPAGLVFNAAGEYVNFEHPTQVVGQRAMLYPQLSLPMQTAAFYVTPKFGLHMTEYGLDRQAAGVPDRLSRQVPILSVDSGVVLERDAAWFGRSLTQTLEPRLYYVQIPARDQSLIPVFDSGLTDFNFAQIFAENRYGGQDRVGDANQLTAAAVSRLIDPETGGELMRGAIGQRFYFRDQHVALPSETVRTNRKTDLLAAFSGQIAPRLFVDAGWQYSPFFERTERVNVGGRYQPEFGKVLNATYRYVRDKFGNIDVSGQWPLFGGWHGVGRYNYSLRDKRIVEAVAGLEYDAGCWVGRMVMHRLATTAATVSTAIFLQLELNGLARLGSNPFDMLKRNIAGYGIINQPAADPVFGAN